MAYEQHPSSANLDWDTQKLMIKPDMLSFIKQLAYARESKKEIALWDPL